MSKAEDYIYESLVHQDYDTKEIIDGEQTNNQAYVTKEDAIISVDLAEKDIRDKSVDCFVHFVEDYCHEAGHWEIYKESEHYTKIFKEMLNKKP